MNIKFEGNLDHISAVQLNYISKFLEEQGYKDKTAIFSLLNQTGDNYMANVRRITVETDDGTSFKMIAKIAVQDPNSRSTFGTDVAFSNEALIYSRLFTKFAELEENYKVPVSKRFPHAKCYGVFLEKPYEVILLEDMIESGYYLQDKFEALSDDNVKLVLDNLAHFHAMSYAFKYVDQEGFDEMKGKLTNILSEFAASGDAVILEIFEPLERKVLEWLADEGMIEKKGFLTELWRDLIDKCNKDYDSKFSVIEHGDNWTNNILLRDMGQTKTCIYIDFQMVKPSKPASDLLFFLFTSTIHEQRTTHFLNWLSHYHDCLDTHLNLFGLKAADVHPKEQFDADIKDFAFDKMRHAILIILMALREPSESVDMINEEKNDDGTTVKAVDLLDVTPETMKRFQERVKGMWNTLKQFGLQ